MSAGRVRTACPVAACGTFVRASLHRSFGNRRAGYYEHLNAHHPTLGPRERALLADGMLRAEEPDG